MPHLSLVASTLVVFILFLYLVLIVLSSEGIAYGEVKRMAVLETIDIIEARLGRSIRQVEGYTPVETQDEELEVVAEPQTCTYCHLTEEILPFELTAAITRKVIAKLFLNGPDVTRIKEYGTI